eukprot:3518414-Pyramimonas_sp.AAC.1
MGASKTDTTTVCPPGGVVPPFRCVPLEASQFLSAGKHPRLLLGTAKTFTENKLHDAQEQMWPKNSGVCWAGKFASRVDVRGDNDSES